MKKILGSILCSLILVLTLTACGKNYDKIKSTIGNLTTTAFDKNGQTYTFNHKYDAEGHTNDDYEKTDYTIKYDGNGIITTEVEGLTEDINNFSLYDLVSTKKGYLRILQHEKYEYDYKEEDKYDGKKSEDKVNYEMNHEFIIKFDETTVYIACTSKYTDSNDSTKNVDKTFNGKISKESFKESITVDSLNFLYDQLLTMDEFDTNTKVQKYTSDLFIKSKELNGGDFNSFVDKNQVALEESSDKSTISFSYPCDTVISSLFNLDSKSNSRINGKLVIDNTKKDIIQFEYDLKDFLFDTLDGIDKDNSVKVNINEYKLTGDSFTTAVADIKLEKEFKEYTDSEEFLNDLYLVLPTYNE